MHDIGKIYELSYERGFSYSDEGQLLGHMLIGVRMVGEKLRDIPDFPPRLRSLVEHMIISHHGHLEFGSPKTPVFPEAMLLHYLDDLDSKMECMRHLIETDRQFAGNFTSFSSSLERVVLKKDRYLDGLAAEPARAPAPGGGAWRRAGSGAQEPLAIRRQIAAGVAAGGGKAGGLMRKTATRAIPPPLELLCLSALWSRGQGSVKEVRELVSASRPLAYTTVMTVLDRLARRGIVTRRKAGRAFVYAPAVTRDSMRRLALQEFLDSYFESSTHELLQFLRDEPRAETAAPAAMAANGLDPALL